MVSKVRGHFTRLEGEVVTAADPRASTVNATIDLDSIDTNNVQRDDDLRVQLLRGRRASRMTYRSTGIRHSEDGFDVDGELTLHGVTRQVTLALDVNGFARDPFGGTRAGFSATAATWPHMVPRSCSAPSTGAAWRRPPPASTRSAFDQAGRWRRWRQPPSRPVAC